MAIKLPFSVTGAGIGFVAMCALIFALPSSDKGDKLTPIVVKPIAMMPAPDPAPAPEAPAVAAEPPPSSAPPPAKPGLHPRPRDKSLPAKVAPPALPPQPAPVAPAPVVKPVPAAVPAKAGAPSAWQCFKVRQAANGMTPAEQQDYAAKYMTPAQRETAKACLGTK